MRALRPLFLAATTAAALIALGCQDNPDAVTSPQLARVKPNRTLTVEGGGSGSGKVTAPQVLDVAAMTCAVAQGSFNPTECTRIYPFKSVVTLTAQADEQSTFIGWSGACSGTAATCRVTMSQSRTVRASFGGGGPPSFTLNVVGSGNGSGSVQSQSVSPAISCTITSGSVTGGVCTGSYPSGTPITLTATPTSDHQFSGWSGSCSGTGTCSFTISSNAAVTAAFSAPPRPEASVGHWDAPLDSRVIAVHLNLLKDGRVLLWGHAGEPQVWNPLGGGFTQYTNSTCNGTCELFCAGQEYLADGRLLVAGGHNEDLGDGHGIPDASIFDGSSWLGTAKMKYGRWYPSLVTLENGNVVALSGSTQPGVSAPAPERWNGSTWTELTGAVSALPLYPRTFVEPKNGWVFLAGEANSTYLNPTGSGGWTNAGLANSGIRRVPERDYGAAVMLDSKVLYIGGGGATAGTNCKPPENTAEIIDLAAGTPTWNLVASMQFRRRHPNATILPTGQVLVTGGSGACGFSDESGAVFAAELYDPPPIDRWTTLSNASVVRVYHGTSILLPDGRVMVSGSGDGGGVTPQLTYETFSPPYLYKGARPVYSLSSPVMQNGLPLMRYNQPFVVQTSNAASIRKVTLIRLVSATHAFGMSQRLNTLSFVASGDGTSLTLTAPVSGRIAPPGPYLLFIVNDVGVPSVAQTILVGP